MGVTKTVRKDDLPKLKQTIEELKSKKIKIGIFGSDDSHILMVARVQEFGCDINITPKMRAWLHYNGLHVKKGTSQIHIPERSFIRRTTQERQDELNKIIKEGLTELLTFRIDVNVFCDRVGQFLAGLTQEVLTEVSSPPNHPFTIERKKGKSNPLIDSGRLRESITWKVE